MPDNQQENEKYPKCVDTFRKPPYRHNCAQAVAFRYAPFARMSHEEAAAKFEGYAAGRAPGGLCGALFTAECFMPDKVKEIEAAFAKVTDGRLTCREIKGANPVLCPVCVDTIDQVMEQILLDEIAAHMKDKNRKNN